MTILNAAERNPPPLIGGTSARKLKAHPAAELFPMMTDAEIDDLGADIKAQGLRRPIVILDGLILDGRNRYEACRRAGIEPRLEQWAGAGSPTAMVLSENLQRRHLTIDQRALIALEAQGLFAQEAKDRQRAAGGDRRSVNASDRLPPRGGKRSEERAPTAAAQAAQTAGVSARSVERARRVQAAQPAMLDRVRDGTMTLKQAEKVVTKGERLKEVLAYTPPKGRFSVIVADPPWRYDDTLDGSDLARGGLQYPTMSVEEICAMKVGETLGAPDCALWLWVTNAFMIDGTGARVVREWGFTPKALLTWRKDRWGAGRYLRNQTEHAILAIRGKPMVSGEKHSTILDAPRRGHSEKPAEAFALFEAVTPGPPPARLELFAREPREGWVASGSELTPARRAAETPKRSRSLKACTICGESDGHTPSECVMAEPVDAAESPAARPVAPTIVESADREERGACGRRLNGAGWCRSAMKARVENSVDVCHHCGADGARTKPADGLICVRNSDELPNGTFCRWCQERLRENPREWDRHSAEPPKAKRLPPIVPGVTPFKGPFQVRVKGKPVGATHRDRNKAVAWAKEEEGLRAFELTDSRGRSCYAFQWSPSMGKPPKKKVAPKPSAQTRPSKKFPRQSGLTEKCTACGAEKGRHAGTTCPTVGAKQRRAA